LGARRWTGRTRQKKTTAARLTKVIRASKKIPYLKTELRMVKTRFAKLLFPMTPMIGLIKPEMKLVIRLFRARAYR
jgi:hypothetical protein